VRGRYLPSEEALRVEPTRGREQVEHRIAFTADDKKG
jgi:hypothetical protein